VIIDARILRAIIGITASSAVLVLLYEVPWRIDGALQSESSLFVELALTGAAVLFVAMFVGSCIARINFIAPAAILAIATWILTESFFDPWVTFVPCGETRHYGGVNFIILFVATCGAISGAIFGRWFSNLIADNAAHAA
jgi:hypothetical protein